MDQKDGNLQPHAGKQNSAMADLQALISSCENVEDFQELLQKRGIWLNTKAAESAFNSLRSSQSEELTDDNLEAVTGGIGGYGMGAMTLDTLLLHLVSMSQ